MMNFSSTVQLSLEMCYKIIKMFDWLLDLYVVDFFVDNHWQMLPSCWRVCLEKMEIQVIGDLLMGLPAKSHVLPLSLMALLKSIEVLSIPRKPVIANEVTQDVSKTNCHPQLKNLFLKHVKLKKRHEISLMAALVNKTAVESKCNTVIDFGSGLGHLLRVLAYQYNLRTAGIECQHILSSEARKLDSELEYTLKKYVKEDEMASVSRPLHYNLTLKCHKQLIELSLPESMEQFGLIGLHPCGDLGPFLLKHFIKHDNVKFVCVAGCCYMKLTQDGYPMSVYVKKLNHQLSYPAMEISCHAIEVYSDRLRKGQYEDLKIHAYRAALERIFRDYDPLLRHAPVRSIKHTDTMTFEGYCALAVDRLPTKVPVTDAALYRARTDVAQWRRVVAVYSLRLALAPLVETAVLLDRVMYVLEHGFRCEIHPIFDPKISSRNHIIKAIRL